LRGAARDLESLRPHYHHRPQKYVSQAPTPYYRKPNNKLSEFIGNAFNFDGSPHPIDNLSADVQSEPRALTDRLGREKRLEDLGLDLLRNARAVIPHDHRHLIRARLV